MPPLSVRRASLVACLSAATVLGTVAATALAPAANAATTITVAADGSGNYTTVQAAIAAASSGTVISIKAGTYYVRLYSLNSADTVYKTKLITKPTFSTTKIAA